MSLDSNSPFHANRRVLWWNVENDSLNERQVSGSMSKVGKRGRACKSFGKLPSFRFREKVRVLLAPLLRHGGWPDCRLDHLSCFRFGTIAAIRSVHNRVW